MQLNLYHRFMIKFYLIFWSVCYSNIFSFKSPGLSHPPKITDGLSCILYKNWKSSLMSKNQNRSFKIYCWQKCSFSHVNSPDERKTYYLKWVPVTWNEMSKQYVHSHYLLNKVLNLKVTTPNKIDKMSVLPHFTKKVQIEIDWNRTYT